MTLGKEEFDNQEQLYISTSMLRHTYKDTEGEWVCLGLVGL